ncbi:alpha/beta fold hydrolase [Paenibacillus sp. GCM10012306]|uniref:alpha/beta fold hydrolase n=1 Tax=Paenibacillus sp. GCM10012306 TaxID=3317342 RepID=UPI00360B7CFD
MYPYYPQVPQFSYPNYRLMPSGFYYSPYPASGWFGQYDARETFESHRLPPEQKLTFVLVHGSWADAHFWDGIAAELRKRGHVVYTPEYAGHGKDPNKAVTHEMITKSVVDYVTRMNLQDIVLVGHSFGGSVIQKVAEQIPDRIRRLVFWDAFVLKDDEAIVDELPSQTAQGFAQLRAASNDDTIMLPFPLFRALFVNTATLEQAKWIYAGVTPEPAKPLFEKLDLKKFYTLTTPSSYLFFYQDNVFTGAEGLGWYPHMASRLGMFRLIVGDGDHMTDAFVKPAYVAQKLYEAGRD